MKLLTVTSGIKFNPVQVACVVFLPKELKTVVSLLNGQSIFSDYDFKTTCEIVEKELGIEEANALKVRNSLAIEQPDQNSTPAV